MSLDLGDLVGYLEIDPTRWNKGIDDALRSVDQFGDRARPRAEAAGKKAGDAFGSGLVPQAERAGEDAGAAAGEGLLSKGSVAAGAAGAAFGLAFWEAMDVEAGRDKLAAQLGATARDSRRYGRIAANLYAGAWGESIDEVNTGIASVVTSITGMDESGDRRIRRLTARALDFASAFEVDVVRATQVAGVVMDSGLAKTGVRAFDLLTRASQKVPVQLREDVLDATEEYSQFFSTLGYNGREAFSILVDASEKGMYGIDKAGDAIKEFTIRSTDMSTASKDAYKLIGLDAETMADKIVKGGDDARQATQKIIDGLLAIESPSTRANAAIALFGTPIEDLNVRDIPEFLRQLRGTSTALDGVEGSSKRVGQTLADNAQTKVTAFKRRLETEFVGYFVDEVIPVLEDDVIPAVERFGDWFSEDGGPALRDFADDLKPVVGGVKELVGFLNDLPSAAKIGGLAALLGGVAYGKVRGGGLGGGGVLGTAGAALGLSKPVPVFVTNPGMGGSPGGVPGGRPGKVASTARNVGRVLPWLAVADAAYEATAGDLYGLDSTPGERRQTVSPFGVGLRRPTGGLGGDEPEEKLDRLISKAGVFGEALDLVGNKKVHPELTVPGLPRAHGDLQRFLQLEIDAGRPITPYIALTGVERAMGQIATLNAGLDALVERGVDNGATFMHGGTTSAGRGRRGGPHEETPRGRGPFDGATFHVQPRNYNDFMQDMQRRAQLAQLDGVRGRN